MDFPFVYSFGADKQETYLFRVCLCLHVFKCTCMENSYLLNHTKGAHAYWENCGFCVLLLMNSRYAWLYHLFKGLKFLGKIHLRHSTCQIVSCLCDSCLAMAFAFFPSKNYIIYQRRRGSVSWANGGSGH